MDNLLFSSNIPLSLNLTTKLRVERHNSYRFVSFLLTLALVECQLGKGADITAVKP